MTDFEPVTDLPEGVDADDSPVASSAKLRDATIQSRRRIVLAFIVVAFAALMLLLHFEPWRVLVAAATMYVIFRVGFAVLGAFARPVPEPPPPGELRRVRLSYRCSQCGTELKMTLASDQAPEAPRHCTEEMDLVATEDDML